MGNGGEGPVLHRFFGDRRLSYGVMVDSKRGVLQHLWRRMNRHTWYTKIMKDGARCGWTPFWSYVSMSVSVNPKSGLK